MLLAGVLFLISCQNLHNYECDYFSIRIPDSWKFEIEQLPVPQGQLISLSHSNREDIINAMAMVMCMNQQINPTLLLDQQVIKAKIPLFNKALF